MPPLQLKQEQLFCHPSDTGISSGPLGNQFGDLCGHHNSAGGRPEERHGYAGYTHGVTILRGGVPRDMRPRLAIPSSGTVLFVSSTLHANFKEAPAIKPGTADERVGTSGKQAHRAAAAPGDTPAASAKLCTSLRPGTVLATFPHLLPDLRGALRTNTAGGRPSERLGVRDGFSAGARVWAGGKPRNVPVPDQSENAGTVLFRSTTLRPNMQWEGPTVKPGTRGERQGAVGSFQHGATRLRMPTAADAELWEEPGQSAGRRFAQGHFVAGCSILAGGAPMYVV